jgi:Ser/Thr protein kinase RdoA (MazF antagonist)
MPFDRDLLAVLAYYALDATAVRRIQPIGNAGGWSGSRLWRVTNQNGGETCLRRWPQEHPTPDRLRFIHGVLHQVAQNLPVVAAPLPTSSKATFVEYAGQRWELTFWKPGNADYHAHPNRIRLRATTRIRRNRRFKGL